MWIPKSQEFEALADKIAKEYMDRPKGNGLSVPEIARIYRLSVPSIYRYLRYKNVPIRPKRRDDK